MNIGTAAEEVNSSLYSRQRYIRMALQRTLNHTRDDNADLVGDTESSKKIPDKEMNQQQQVHSPKMGATDDSHTNWNVEEQQQQRMVCWNVTCCHLILHAPNIDNKTKWYARMLLDEISYDEEEEEEMQHSVNDDT